MSPPRRTETAADRRTLRLTVGSERLAVCRLDGEAPVPDGLRGEVVSVTRTPGELSVVCAEAAAPAAATAVDGGWRALMLAGPFDLSTEVGVLLAVLQPLAAAGVGIFAVSTYDTDHVLVHEPQLEAAVAALRAAGHAVDGG